MSRTLSFIFVTAKRYVVTFVKKLIERGWLDETGSFEWGWLWNRLSLQTPMECCQRVIVWHVGGPHVVKRSHFLLYIYHMQQQQQQKHLVQRQKWGANFGFFTSATDDFCLSLFLLLCIFKYARNCWKLFHCKGLKLQYSFRVMKLYWLTEIDCNELVTTDELFID